MSTRFPFQDVGYSTNIFFAVGATLLATQSLLYILEATQPGTDFADETPVITATSCLGDFFFFLGCSTAVLEELNTKRLEIDASGYDIRVIGEAENSRSSVHIKLHLG